MCKPKQILGPKLLGVLAAASLMPLSVLPSQAAIKNSEAVHNMPSEAQILGLISAINQNEINAAEEASKRQLSQEVYNYAAKMQQEHTANLEKTIKLGLKLDIRPASTSENKEVQKQIEKGEKELDKLTRLSPDKFEKAYIDAMVKDHSEALNLIDKKLMNMSNNTEVKDHLTETREHVSTHLEEAKKIQADLRS